MTAPSPGRTNPYPTLRPGAGRAANRLAAAIRRPIEAFMHVEAAGGIALLIAAAVALVWVNSRWHESYAHLWASARGCSPRICISGSTKD